MESEASFSRPVPSERAKIKAIPKVKLTEAAVPRPASLEKARGKAEPPTAAKSARVKKAQPPLVGSAGRALSLGGASAKARSVSPLPVASASAAKAGTRITPAAKSRGEGLAPTEAKASAFVERPLIALGWHRTISHERLWRKGSSFIPSGILQSSDDQKS